MNVKNKQSAQNAQVRYNKNKTDMRRITTISPTNAGTNHQVSGGAAAGNFKTIS